MAGHAAKLRTPQRRIRNIKAMAAEIAVQQREVMHQVVQIFQGLYLLFALACITAGAVAASNGRHQTALGWGVPGVCLLLLWVLAKGATTSLHKFVKGLRQELAKPLPESDQEPLADGLPGADRLG